MVASDIQSFSEGRTKVRAYFCYLFTRNIPNRLPSLTEEMIVPRLLKIKGDLQNSESVYLLDKSGVQITPTYTDDGQKDEDIGDIRAHRAYYYRAVREGRCSITDPYPSIVTGGLTVTASQPIYDENAELKYVACLDMQFEEALKLAHLNTFDTLFSKIFKYAYASFAFALIAVAILLFFSGIESFFVKEITVSHLVIDDMFRATILLTLSLAIFDLAKTLIEEEVLGQNLGYSISAPHKTMVKFLGSIIIALSIEALMLVFKFAITDPEKLMNAMFIVTGVAMLIISLAIYIKFTKSKIEH